MSGKVSETVIRTTDDIPFQFIIQECEDGAVADTAEDSLTIFLRRWHPETMQLGKFQEVTLNSKSCVC